METKVKKTITHDRLAVEATFPDGSSVRFSVTRSGERVSASVGPDANRVVAALSAAAKFRSGEKNAERVDRIALACSNATSQASLVEELA